MMTKLSMFCDRLSMLNPTGERTQAGWNLGSGLKIEPCCAPTPGHVLMKVASR
jgi:hypothetical protein